MFSRQILRACLAGACLLPAFALDAAAQPCDFTGHWEGEIELPGMTLGVILDITENDGVWSGTIDIPMQGAKGLPLGGFDVRDCEIQVGLVNVPGDPVFHGKLAGGKITGDFTQGGQTFPFSLGREAVAALIRPQEPKPPFPYREEEVSIRNGEITLAATLTLPEGEGPFPAVMLLTGSGPQNRDEELFGHKPFLVLADHLTRAGIAVLRADDRGMGGSTGGDSQPTLADFAEDALAGVRHLKRRPEIHPQKIGLLGHSEGGITGPLAASRSEDVAFVILLAGTGVPGSELILRQLEMLYQLAGGSEEQIAQAKAVQAKAFDLVVSGADQEQVRAQFEKVVASQSALKPGADQLTPEQVGQEVTKATLQALTPYFPFFLSHDPRPVLRELSVPVLALCGELDKQVDPRQNLPEIQKALAEGGNLDVTVRELPGLNHLFQQAETGGLEEYYTIQETINPVVLETVRRWILERFGG